MNKILIARAKMYLQTSMEMRSILIRDLWLDVLKNNEGDHLHALYDLEVLLAHFEEHEEYEVCRAIQDTIDNYQRLSHLKLR